MISDEASHEAVMKKAPPYDGLAQRWVEEVFAALKWLADSDLKDFRPLRDTHRSVRPSEQAEWINAIYRPRLPHSVTLIWKHDNALGWT